MTTINPIYVQPQPQQTKSKHKVQAQVGNIVTGGLGLGAVYGGTKSIVPLGRKFPTLDNAFTTFAEKVGGMVGKLSYKVAEGLGTLKYRPGVKPVVKSGKTLFKFLPSKCVQLLHDMAREFKCDARNAVGKYMFAPAVILTVAGIVGKTIFNAGKISAE